jgi:hypothetical protein
MALEMKFGGDPKQMKVLGVLGVVLVVILYFNYFSGPEETPRSPQRTASTNSIPQANLPATSALVVKKKTQVDRRTQEFRPRVGPARPEDRLDPMKVDPSLRLELLARLEKVQISGGSRSLFDFSNVPSPVAANIPKIIPSPKKGPSAPKPFIGPMNKPPDPPPLVAQKPIAPPIPLKFYGFTSGARGALRRGFFLDGDDIIVAAEGELIKKRYKVIRIGLANVTMEDTQFEQQQTLPIVPDNGSGGI